MLWYWNDWQGGTVTMSRHLKGCYIDLLHAQFNNGHLSLDEIKTVLGADFAAWNTLQKKFETDPKGLFFNKRLEEEQIKRREWTASRRTNAKKHKPKHMQDHMQSHMENENEDRNDNTNRVEKRLKEAFDEIYVDRERMSWAHVNFDFELAAFKNKVEGSPGHYIAHDLEGLRQAFQYQLRNAKPKRDERTKQHPAVKLAEDFAKRHGKGNS